MAPDAVCGWLGREGAGPAEGKISASRSFHPPEGTPGRVVAVRGGGPRCSYPQTQGNDLKINSSPSPPHLPLRNERKKQPLPDSRSDPFQRKPMSPSRVHACFKNGSVGVCLRTYPTAHSLCRGASLLRMGEISHSCLGAQS